MLRDPNGGELLLRVIHEHGDGLVFAGAIPLPPVYFHGVKEKSTCKCTEVARDQTPFQPEALGLVHDLQGDLWWNVIERRWHGIAGLAGTMRGYGWQKMGAESEMRWLGTMWCT